MMHKIDRSNPFGCTPKAFILEYVQKRVGIVTGAKVLDFGCRDGDFLFELKKRTPQVSAIGVDLDGEAIAKAKAKKIDIDFRHIQKNHKFNVPDNTFDVVTIIGVVEHVFDQVSLLRELTRILKHEGVMLVAVPGQHLFSFLDMGNFKFRFPRLHKFFYRLSHSEEDYRARYVSNEFGCIGDIETEKAWHEHFSQSSMQRLLNQVGHLEIVEKEGMGFFHRILNNFKYFLPKRIKPSIQGVIDWDFQKFSQTELIFILKKKFNKG